MSLAWDNVEFMDAVEDWRREDFATDERQLRLIQQQRPGMFRSFREFAWAFMWVWAPVIAVIIWRLTK